MNIFQKIKLYGYRKAEKPLEVDINMHKIYDQLYQKKTANNVYEEDYPYNIYNLQKDASDFFVKANISLHEVPTITFDTLEEIIYNGIPFNENMIEKINPLDLPVEYITKSIFFGSVYKVVNLSDDIIFLGINLGKNISKITLPSYIHEITHTQLDSVRGSIEDYCNSELLPIFMEKLAALEMGNSVFLQTVEDLRSYYTLTFISSLMLEQNLSEEEIRDNDMYVKSFLMANNLFYTYLESDNYTKAQIMKKIQDIFDGKLTLEALLDIMNINLENSSDSKVIEKCLKK